MFRPSRVVLWVFKSAESIELARAAATLFPESLFRVVILAPVTRARFFLTTLYREVTEVIAREVSEAVERELRSFGVRLEGVDVVRGRAPGAVESYVRSVGCDVLGTSLAMELGPEDVDHSPVTRVVEGAGIPVLLNTPLSKTLDRVRRVALAVGAYRFPSRGIEVVRYLASVFSIELEVLGVEEGADARRLRGVASSIGVARASARSLGEVATGRGIEALEEATSSVDLLVVDRDTIEPPPSVRTRRRRLSIVERIMIAVSRSPILFAQ
ncbi:MAG: hypothetical protein GXO32_05580 [Crenarchaeota archaeon]|nr:hypothetical protein [Thermoproteota archaeon]